MKVTGWASTRDLDHYRHVVRPDAFNESIKAKGLGGPKGIKFLWQHERSEVIGRIEKLEPQERGVWIEAEIVEDIRQGADAAAKIKANGGLSFSVGFYVDDAEIRELPSGREFLDITKGDLEEVSVVVVPGQAEAVIVEYEE